MNFSIKLFFLIFIFITTIFFIGIFKNKQNPPELIQIQNENLKGFDFLTSLKKKVFNDLETELNKKNERNRNH